MSAQNIALAIHGGAGTILRETMTADLQAQYEQGLKAALAAGYSILEKGGTALDAVEASVKSLEDFPLFNAGRGAVFNHAGKHEMDAAIMEGKHLGCGAVAGIQGIKNPVALARAVMEKTEHVLLMGKGAEEFAKAQNFPVEPAEYFFTQQRYDQLQEALQEGKVQLDHSEKKFGTVGAVALDAQGNLAASTSTGGMTNKQFGRVGDTPLIGAGTWASNDTCAISCTGHGELFIKAAVAHDIHCLMLYKGLSLQEAADLVVYEKLVKIGGEGGLIAVDKDGNIALPFNSEGMYRGSISSITALKVLIYK
ncbi:MAG: isoaspartyl peptidase/L-asparaginase [Chitinophagaceae bacterium]